MDSDPYESLPSRSSSPWPNDYHRALQPYPYQYIGKSTIPSKLLTTTERQVEHPNTISASLKALYMAWRWEFASCLLILAIPFIILATLYPHDGQPLPQWPFQISVNTLLSVYSIALRGGLSFIAASCIGQLQWVWFSQGRPLYDLVRYDNAGRGAWGSLQILWTHRLYQPLTTLGALLIVFSMGIDPSIQQLISSSDCSVAIEGEKATLPRTNLFYDATNHQGKLNSEFQSAFLRGLTQSASDLYPKCSTGNCSFSDSYSTLGFCSLCEDSSKEISIETFYTTAFNRSTDLIAECSNNSSIIYTIKSGISMDSQSIHIPPQVLWQLNVVNSITTSGSPCTDLSHIQLAGMGIVGRNAVYRIAGHGKVIVKILVGKTPVSDNHIDITTGDPIEGCDQEDLAGSWRCRGYGAATCTIQPCVRAYSATIEAGRLTERLISESGTLDMATGEMENETLRDGGSVPELGMIDTHCLTSLEINELADQGYIVENTTRWLPYSAVSDSGVGSSLTNSLLTQKCLYLMDKEFASDTTAPVIAENFNGILKGGLGNVWKNGFLINSFDGPQTLQYIYDSGHVDLQRIQETFSNVSELLTTYIRTRGHENYSEPATGQVLHYATCIHVRWQWISFISSIIFLTMILFIMTVCSQPLKQFPAWKTSFLPWLMYGPGSSNILKADELEGVSYGVDDMEKKAKEITVTWKPLPDPCIEL